VVVKATWASDLHHWYWFCAYVLLYWSDFWCYSSIDIHTSFSW
jgi:hypothetical protein